MDDQELRDDPNQGYRPTVIWLTSKFFSERTPGPVKLAMFFGALPLLVVPTSVRHFVLFRIRNETTRTIAEGIPRHIHLG